MSKFKKNVESISGSCRADSFEKVQNNRNNASWICIGAGAIITFATTFMVAPAIAMALTGGALAVAGQGFAIAMAPTLAGGGVALGIGARMHKTQKNLDEGNLENDKAVMAHARRTVEANAAKFRTRERLNKLRYSYS